MTIDDYRAEFLRLTGHIPTEDFLRRVEAAREAGMTDEILRDCLAYDAAVAKALGAVYSRSYGEERGREKACEVIYRRMRKVWKWKKMT